MYKFTTLKYTILFTILAMSVSIFAQSKYATYGVKEPGIARTENTVSKFYTFYPESISGQDPGYQAADPGALIPITDSIYGWRWDTITGGWKINSRAIHLVYDDKNYLTLRIEQQWNGNYLENSLQTMYTYDDRNNRTSETEQIWNSGTWDNSYNISWSYDADNNQKVRLYQTWDGNNWVNSSQSTSDYDANNNLTNNLDQDWNGSSWRNYSQGLSSYDANHFTISNSGKYWNTSGSKVSSGDSAYFYFHTVLGTDDLLLQDSDIKVFPNPGSRRMTIASSNSIRYAEICNLYGERVWSAPYLNSPKLIELDISALHTGIYILKLYSGSTIYNRKIVVQ